MRKLPHRRNVKVLLKIDPKIDWPDFIIHHIWKFYDSIALCWNIF